MDTENGGSFGDKKLVRTAQTELYTPPNNGGGYNVVDTTVYREKKQPSAGFGGSMANTDRTKTGYLQSSFQYRAPGPGTYDSPSSLQTQGDSNKPSSSNFKFGTSNRDDITKKCYMPGMRQEGTALQTPGPGAYSPTSVDMECRSTSKSRAPAHSFGGPLSQKKRGDIYHSGHLAGTKAECGPGSYNVDGSMRTQTISTKATSARCHFGTGDRAAAALAVAPGYMGKSKSNRDTPGPGTYTQTSSMAYQADARKKTSRSSKFGTETRDRVTKLRTRDLLATPGPGTYGDIPGMGLQHNSKYRSTPRSLFGTSARKPIGIVRCHR